jgi:hypothetical protein
MVGLDPRPKQVEHRAKKKRKKLGLANTDHGRHLEEMGAQRLAVEKD